jgi:hypothetical protein
VADFEPDRESVDRAEALSSRLFADLRAVLDEGPSFDLRRERFSERRYAEEAEGVPVGDVVSNVDQMAGDFAVARRWGGEFPCLTLDEGGLAPLSLTGISGIFRRSQPPESWPDFLMDALPDSVLMRVWRRFLRSQGGEGIVVTDINAAAASVERNLRGFLSYRFAGIRQWARGSGNDLFGGSGSGGAPPPGQGAAGGLQVQVSCGTPGLRIHVAPAYFINWVFFGSPTTPVSSYLLPGRYVFAGDGSPLHKRTPDPGVFSIPPTYNPVLTRF